MADALSAKFSFSGSEATATAASCVAVPAKGDHHIHVYCSIVAAGSELSDDIWGDCHRSYKGVAARFISATTACRAVHCAHRYMALNALPLVSTY